MSDLLNKIIIIFIALIHYSCNNDSFSVNLRSYRVEIENYKMKNFTIKPIPFGGAQNSFSDSINNIVIIISEEYGVNYLLDYLNELST